MSPSAALVPGAPTGSSPLAADGPVAAAAVGEPPSTLADTVAAGMGLAVAPTTGRFRSRAPSGVTGPGVPIGVITGGGGRTDEVCVPVPARVCRFLAMEGQPVQAGQALAWIRLLDS